MKILSIGNSFSEDAQTYLSEIARLSGKKITSYNMMIGGCSLERHYRNMLSGDKAYTLQINGESTGIFMNLADVLQAGWGAITLQQASFYSPRYETYQPYLSELAAFVRRYAPKTKIYIHETWAYEDGTERVKNAGFENQADMYQAIHASYKKAAEDIDADGIIPSGTAFQYLLRHGVEKVHHDGAHASHSIGHVTLGAVWLSYFTGLDVRGLDWSALKTRVPVTAEEYALAQEAAYAVCHDGWQVN